MHIGRIQPCAVPDYAISKSNQITARILFLVRILYLYSFVHTRARGKMSERPVGIKTATGSDAISKPPSLHLCFQYTKANQSFVIQPQVRKAVTTTTNLDTHESNPKRSRQHGRRRLQLSNSPALPQGALFRARMDWSCLSILIKTAAQL